MKESDKNQLTPKKTDQKVLEAVRIVNEAIMASRKYYEEIANKEEQSPVSLEGRTKTGHEATLMVDPKEVAEIFLDYDYPTWNTLGEDAPDGMWIGLAIHFGLDSVDYVDL